MDKTIEILNTLAESMERNGIEPYLQDYMDLLIRAVKVDVKLKSQQELTTIEALQELCQRYLNQSIELIASPMRVFLTPEQAIAMLPENEKILVYYCQQNSASMPQRGTYCKEDIVRKINHPDYKCELAGEQMASMNHKLIVWRCINGGEVLFVQTRSDWSEEKELS